ncbi:MAG: deoxyribonuclease IV [bacterium]
MYFVGPHVSIGGGVAQAPVNAAAVGATGFGMFTKNQVQWHAPPLSSAGREQFAAGLLANQYTPQQILPHAGYLINLANPDEAAHAKALASFINELQRCEELGLRMLNLHPGSHLRKLEPMAACARVAESINEALRQTRDVIVVIENTAGQGACLGSTFAELAAILAGVQNRSRVGICLDTAHTFAAGFDIRTRDGWQRTLDDFDRTVGVSCLRGMHLNDSRAAFNTHVDRHESLGEGHLGWEPFRQIMRNPLFENMPLIIETPDEERWPEEIRKLLTFAD